MSHTKTLWRLFLAYEDQKQETWLEAQASEGWHLSKPGMFRFTFGQGEPKSERYRMDYEMLRGEKRAEYLVLFQDAGWDFLGEVFNRYYFRARPEAFSPEIISDPESRRDRIRRELSLLGALLGITAWDTSLFGIMVLRDCSRQGDFRDWLIPLSLVLCALLTLTLVMSWCVWKLVRAMTQGK